MIVPGSVGYIRFCLSLHSVQRIYRRSWQAWHAPTLLRTNRASQPLACPPRVGKTPSRSKILFSSRFSGLGRDTERFVPFVGKVPLPIEPPQEKEVVIDGIDRPVLISCQKAVRRRSENLFQPCPAFDTLTRQSINRSSSLREEISLWRQSRRQLLALGRR